MRLDDTIEPPPAARPMPARRRARRAPLLPFAQVLEHTIAVVFAMERTELVAETRGIARHALARHVTLYLAHVAGGMTLSEAGRLFGRDRSTAAYACARIESFRDDPAFDAALGVLERTVTVLAGPRGR